MRNNRDRRDRAPSTSTAASTSKSRYEEQQAAFIAECRNESSRDKSIPLAYPTAVKVELGLPPHVYYIAKHKRGEVGSFYPVHLMRRHYGDRDSR
jgi:hypothetical protein